LTNTFFTYADSRLNSILNYMSLREGFFPRKKNPQKTQDPHPKPG